MINELIYKWLNDTLGESILTTVLADLIIILLSALASVLIYVVMKVINSAFMAKSPNPILKKLAVTTHEKHLMMKL